ncbi:HCCA isomerase/glutathione S-transferase kappa [Xylaria intraflava]|nr:HCCA isomerase/glutathione S-transferase kappa [Xylaria intraflava]
MGAARITLFIDVVSPFAYEAYYILRNNAAFRDVKKTYVPMLLGGLMKMTGNTPPVQVKNKDAWMIKDRNLWASTFNIPMQAAQPPSFPPNTLGVMRTLSTIQDETALAKLLDRLTHDFWVDHAQIGQPEVYTAILTEILGPKEAEKALSEAQTQGKEALIKNTDQAYAAGAFGTPWMVCTNAKGETEGFFGVDHLGCVLRFLDLPKSDGTDGWKSLL